MTRNQFVEAAQRAILPGQELANPGGGTSRIKSVRNGRISYVRGKSTISVSIHDFADTYEEFKDRRVSSSDLRTFRPSVFDSDARPAGHSCNATFFFLLVHEMGLAGPLEGTGTRGDPCAVFLAKGIATSNRGVTQRQTEACATSNLGSIC
jgi:hypothetical protein